MTKFAVFLRGINISGKNKIEMAVLKAEFEAAGFVEVSTYLNSGNIVFSCKDSNPRKIIEELIYKKFGLEIPVYVIELDALKEILENTPDWWKRTATSGIAEKLTIRTAGTVTKVCKN